MTAQDFFSSPHSELFAFEDLGSKKVVADFSGGHLSSDGGLLLLRQLDSCLGLTRQSRLLF